MSGASVPTEHQGKISGGPVTIFGVPGITGHTICRTLSNADGGGHIFRKKRYEGVMFNVISVTRGWVGVQYPEK